ncbi:MAG: excinuclease ABC subunit UvrC [Prevotellaceae bacterium]|jgi:excinuclease ABC subunit C|nr:excinuclease ABC subunit UvrC [Prevotellaceae bacterium]
MLINDKIRERIELLPHNPGVYQFFNADEKIIYVGKAKDLKKRVSSYFTNKAVANRKLQVMVSKIADIRHIVVPSESDALLLENNLIKKLQPRYNVLLKDDKTYPWICIKNEAFPRVFSTRKVIKDGSKYFGPYTSQTMARILLDLIRQLYPLRACNLQLYKANIDKHKFKVCLEYHIGNCKGPCEALQTEEDYNESIAMVSSILRGENNDVLQLLRYKMREAAEKMEFEEAQRFKDKLDKLENYRTKSIIVSPHIHNVDVFSILVVNNSAYANFLRVIRGAVVHAQNIEMKLGIEDSQEELLSMVIVEIFNRIGNLSPEIIVPFLPDQKMPGLIYTVPKRGDKLKLLELSERNAKIYRMEKLKQIEKTNPDKHAEHVLALLKQDLNLDEMPYYIECFDNSNIQGTNPVASCVVFKNARPSKNDYRHFNIKTVEGPNDFASMEEIVYRRYSRLINEDKPLPQLIVIDGGKGQLHAAVNSLKKLGMYGKIPVIGLAKRLEEIYFPESGIPLLLDKTSESLRLIMHLRDEAHRFGITFHRNKRSSSFLKSRLESIAGVGEKSVLKLLAHFKSISKIKEASLEELTSVVGARVAENVRQYFYSKNEQN